MISALGFTDLGASFIGALLALFSSTYPCILLTEYHSALLYLFNRSTTANRKISRFPKRKLVQHGVVMALKYGFKVYLVNPAHTSTVGEVLGRRLGLDKHTASAYTLVLRYLGIEPKTLK